MIGYRHLARLDRGAADGPQAAQGCPLVHAGPGFSAARTAIGCGGLAVRHWLAGILLAASGPALAGPVDDLLATCTPLMTVFKQSCIVESLWRCPDGSQLARESEPGDAPSYEQFDADYNLIWSGEEGSEDGVLTVVAVRDPMIVSTLLATGSERTDFRVRGRLVFPAEREIDAYTTLHLTGEDLMLDGVALRVMAMTLGLAIGTGGQVAEVNGTAYYEPARGVIFTGAAEMSFGDNVVERLDEAPLSIALPGTPGFLRTTPLAGCDDQLSILAIPEGERT